MAGGQEVGRRSRLLVHLRSLAYGGYILSRPPLFSYSLTRHAMLSCCRHRLQLPLPQSRLNSSWLLNEARHISQVSISSPAPWSCSCPPTLSSSRRAIHLNRRTTKADVRRSRVALLATTICILRLASATNKHVLCRSVSTNLPSGPSPDNLDVAADDRVRLRITLHAQHARAG